MKMIRKLLPFWLRRRGRLALRWLADFKSGDLEKLAKGSEKPDFTAFSTQIEAEQPFRRHAFWENKIANIRRAADKIERVEIAPGQLFSFWKIIGEPSRRRGYLEGRTLLRGRVAADPGGGLCQLSGIVYWLALRGGLEIAERWPHSVDLYLENERFAPLGADATVFFGFKDLRFRNPFSQPLAFAFSISAEKIEARLLSPAPLAERSVVFEREDLPDRRRRAVAFFADDLERKKPLAESIYALPAEG